MTARVALDTGILIWSRKRKYANEANKDKARRLRLLLAQLADIKAQVLVPAICLGEFLCGVEASKRAEVAAQLSRQYEIVPDDAKTALIAADLFTGRRGLPPADQIERGRLKVDVFVVASAIGASATAFFTLDASLRKFCQNGNELARPADA